ncbi:MAG: HAMP domain-containing protein [Lachnospiraceae bacterium]|jgi:two-component system sensor histidine kinase VanS|nr:HAMP domain-containing protein [Lachnospiraceae bacterium]
MKHSIRVRMVLALGGLLAATIFFCWFVNITLLGRYYEQSKIKTCGELYHQIDSIYQESEGDEDITLYLEKTGSRQNISLYIFNIYLSSNTLFYQVKYPSNLNRFQEEQLTDRISQYYSLEYLFQEDQEDGKLLYEEDDYRIYKRFDKRMEAYYIELFGQLSGGDLVFMRSNFFSIQESAGVANRFLAYTGLVVTAIGIFLAYFIGRGFTRPIQQLSGIAKEISRLNFDVRYETGRQDEIGELGRSINLLSEQLETKISELKSANNELKGDIEKKERIDEMRKEFLSNVSHELKTPIALIQGYAEGLKDNISEDQESREFYCDVIIDEAAKMNHMVKKLLTLNQIEFGNGQVEFERFDITALLRSVLNATNIMFRQKEVTLDFPEYDPVYVWGDEYRIEEVITNYISNALNHVEQAGRISVRLKLLEGRVRVSVFNTGQPIPEEDIDLIWEKFYKVDKARTREYGGNGIGLSIVKAIMNSINQACGVKNWENGVEFWFELDRQS